MLTLEDLKNVMIDALEEEEIDVMQGDIEGKFLVKVDDKYEYDVFVGEEARDKAVRDNIEERLCYFETSFLQHRLKIWLSSEKIDKIKSLEDNELIMTLLQSFDSLVDDAIIVDGRGHFLASDDGIEHEVEGEFDGHTLYYYRV